MTRRFAVPLDFTSADNRFRERFWSKVDQREPDECWPWLAYCKPGGYGQFTVVKGKFMTASRVALALTRPLALGEVACHTCDNPPCCNPAHLFAGTQADNANDCIQKGRGNRSRGELTGAAKLTEQHVREIRSHKYRHGLYERLGREYGVSGKTIRQARDGVYWRHVA